MDSMQGVENWVRSFLYFKIEDESILAIGTSAITNVLGDWMLDPQAWLVAAEAGLVWFLVWALFAARLYRQGNWRGAFACYAIGFEGAWIWLSLLFIAADRLAQFIVWVLPFQGWTFFVVSALTGVFLWKHGVQNGSG